MLLRIPSQPSSLLSVPVFRFNSSLKQFEQSGQFCFQYGKACHLAGCHPSYFFDHSMAFEEGERPRKKRKQTESGSSKGDNRRLFAPFRALGFITNHVPFAMQVRSYKGATGAPRVHILTCLGRAWAEFEGEKMKLLFVGMQSDLFAAL